MENHQSKAVDPAFLSVSKNSSAFVIWRVEVGCFLWWQIITSIFPNIFTPSKQELKLVQQPKDSHGKFYSGDSYLIYSAFEPSQPCGTALQVSQSFFLCVSVYLELKYFIFSSSN